MSMTKRHLESLPQAEQDAILGGIDNAYISPDEENELEVLVCRGCGCAFLNESLDSRYLCRNCATSAENEPTDDELAEWARALIEEEDEQC